MTTPKLYMNSNDADLLIKAFPSLDEHIHVLHAADDLTYSAYIGLKDRLNQNLKEGKPIAPVKIRDEKTSYWLASRKNRG